MPNSRCVRSASFVAVVVAWVLGIAANAQESADITLSPLRTELYHEQWIDFNKNGQRDTYELADAEIDARVNDLLQRMTINEKTGQLVTLYGYKRVLRDDVPNSKWPREIWKDGVANIDEHINGIPGWRGKQESPYVWPPSEHARAINEVQRWFIEETRLGIPVDFTNEGIRGLCYYQATNFPAQVGIGATWNPDLVTQIGQVTATEARAAGYTNIYSPILDLARDPRWGRVVECYGEDPYLVAKLGIHQARALQATGVASTAKHYAVYSVPEGGRDGNARTNPQVTAREVRQIYLAPFEAVVREVGILGVMSSYNDYDGVPVSGSYDLLTTHLRSRMGFSGYVVSDSGAVSDLWKKHRVASSMQDAIIMFLEAGGNVCTAFQSPKRYLELLRDAIAEGKISHETINARVRDVLRCKMQLGLFDHPYVQDVELSNQVVGCDEHKRIALQAARESMVLLKNEDGILPLDKGLNSILICGPNAKSTGHSISRYGPMMGDVISVYDGIQAALGENVDIRYAEGCGVVNEGWLENELYSLKPAAHEVKMIDAAVSKAEGVDAVVVVLGESEHTIGESKSRTSLRLTGLQEELVSRLVATGKPIVAVLINGRALAINLVDRDVPGIVEAWFPGEWCGRAVAEVLFGDYNPGGKLPVTFPRSVGQLPLAFPHKPASQAGQGKGHNPNGVGNSRVLDELYPFGHGLSYTEFEYSDLIVSPRNLPPGESVVVSCKIKNVGDLAGDEVVQLYLRDEVSSVITYDYRLRGFERIHLGAGESRQVRFILQPKAMEFLDAAMNAVVEPGMFTVMVGSSSKDIRLQGEFEVMPTRNETYEAKLPR
ncbi:MAG: glycoside hydrolase family 3 N-terminal domain-containing protein [Planctomycetota bacterium]